MSIKYTNFFSRELLSRGLQSRCIDFDRTSFIWTPIFKFIRVIRYLLEDNSLKLESYKNSI